VLTIDAIDAAIADLERQIGELPMAADDPAEDVPVE
jgi:hypothetical protein